MIPTRTTTRSWKTRAMKLSSSIRCRGVWRKLCLHFRVWKSQNNEMADLIKNNPWQKTKILPTGKTRNRVWIKPPID